MKKENVCCEHLKERTPEEIRLLMNRLNRIEGQIRGIKGMVEKNADCPDIMLQVSAANAALNAFNRELLATHMRTCVAEDVRSGNNDKVDELISMLPKLMK